MHRNITQNVWGNFVKLLFHLLFLVAFFVILFKDHSLFKFISLSDVDTVVLAIMSLVPIFESEIRYVIRNIRVKKVSGPGFNAEMFSPKEAPEYGELPLQYLEAESTKQYVGGNELE